MEYSIGEVAKKTGLSQYTLRYYEKEGLLPKIKRKENGIRIFDQETVDWLLMIQCLKATGMSVASMKELVELTLEGEQSIPKRIEKLMQHKNSVLNKIKEMETYLEKIDKKIAWYEGKCETCKL